MKSLAFIMLLSVFSLFWEKFTHIHNCNVLREKTMKAYSNQRYQDAAKSLEVLLFQYKLEDDKLKLNLAFCYLNLKRYSESKALFQQLSISSESEIRSLALLHLGIMISGAKRDMALNYFKSALKANPKNEEARYNYELLIKSRPEDNSNSQKKESENGKHSQQVNYDYQNKPKPNSSNSASGSNQEKNELQWDENGNRMGESLSSQRLRQQNLTEAQAKYVLEQLKNQEIQFVQQLKKNTTNSSHYTGPDY